MRAVNQLIFGIAAAFLATAAQAQQVPKIPQAPAPEPAQSIPFEGGVLTITETPDLDKVLAFNGKELDRDFVLFYDRSIELAGVKVALFSIGPGGNACGTSTMMVWKGETGIESAEAGFEDGCGSPPPAVTQDQLYFVPYLRPGTSDFVQMWSPGQGFSLAGELYYTAQAETRWADIDPARITHPYDLFANEDVYAAAQELLGDDLDQVSLGLSTSGQPEMTPSGILVVRGCVPHACGSQDAFMAVDLKQQKLYFAQQADDQQPKTWPALDAWPAEVKSAMEKALPK